jgi:hypothetical protein
MRLPLQRDIAFKVTDQTLKTIAERKQLRQLTFRSSWQVPDIGRKSLAGCKELQILRLSDCKVTDTGVRALADCRRVQELHLSDCAEVTYAGVKALAQYRRLQTKSIDDWK